MEKIASFTIDHLRLLTGLYVSRTDTVGTLPVTTYDIRMTRPNAEPPMDSAGVHAIEHIGATFLRNDPEWKDKIIYFGPMGCRTGFYLVMNGAYKPAELIELMRNMFRFIIDFEGAIPGASAKDCGNYLDMNLNLAKIYSKKYYAEVLEEPSDDRLNYPE